MNTFPYLIPHIYVWRLKDPDGKQANLAVWMDNVKRKAAPGTMKVTWLPVEGFAGELHCIVEWCEEEPA